MWHRIHRDGNSYREKLLSVNDHLEKVRPYLNDVINNLRDQTIVASLNLSLKSCLDHPKILLSYWKCIYTVTT